MHLQHYYIKKEKEDVSVTFSSRAIHFTSLLRYTECLNQKHVKKHLLLTLHNGKLIYKIGWVIHIYQAFEFRSKVYRLQFLQDVGLFQENIGKVFRASASWKYSGLFFNFMHYICSYIYIWSVLLTIFCCNFCHAKTVYRPSDMQIS